MEFSDFDFRLRVWNDSDANRRQISSLSSRNCFLEGLSGNLTPHCCLFKGSFRKSMLRNSTGSGTLHFFFLEKATQRTHRGEFADIEFVMKTDKFLGNSSIAGTQQKDLTHYTILTFGFRPAENRSHCCCKKRDSKRMEGDPVSIDEIEGILSIIKLVKKITFFWPQLPPHGPVVSSVQGL